MIDPSALTVAGSHAGGAGAPFGKGYTEIYSTSQAFAALKADGSIKAWGDPFTGGESAPTDKAAKAPTVE
jgi:hypothetical protein